MHPTALQRFCLSLGQVSVWTWPGTLGKARWEHAKSPLKLPISNRKRSASFFHSERESPFWQEAGKIPRGGIFRRFKDTPGMSCHSSFFHFDLHYGAVRCGFRYLRAFFPSSKQKSSTSKDGERCDRQVHRSVQVTVEKMSSHKDPRCQNSNKALSSLISGLSVTYELSIHLLPRKHGIWRCHHLQMKAQIFLVPVLFTGYLGIVCFSKKSYKTSQWDCRNPDTGWRKENYKR